MFAEFRKKPFRNSILLAVAVMAGLTTIQAFVTGTWPWMIGSAEPFARWVGDWLPIALAGGGVGLAAYFGLQYSRYRAAARQITRDYYADWAELSHRLDPEGHGAASARVGSGRADATFADVVYDRYQLPHEEIYD